MPIEVQRPALAAPVGPMHGSGLSPPPHRGTHMKSFVATGSEQHDSAQIQPAGQSPALAQETTAGFSQSTQEWHWHNWWLSRRQLQGFPDTSAPQSGWSIQ
jgi:hypothetical protein